MTRVVLGKKLEDYRPWTLGATHPRIIIITPKKLELFKTK